MKRLILLLALAAPVAGRAQAVLHAPAFRECADAPIVPLDTASTEGVSYRQSIRVDMVQREKCLGVIYRAFQQNTTGQIRPFAVLYPPCTPTEPWTRDRLTYATIERAMEAVLASKCP